MESPVNGRGMNGAGCTMRLIRFQKIAADARIFVADDFADSSEIEAILRLARRPAAYGPRRDDTGLHFELPLDAGPSLSAIAARLQAALGFANTVGEHHPPHSDCYAIAEDRLVATAMLWLTACDAGGETRFANTRPSPTLLEPRAGRMAVWLNYASDGTADDAAAHEALPVLRGVKTTLTSFVYGDVSATPRFAQGLCASGEVTGVRFDTAQAQHRVAR